ncbi:MAG TPA: pyridoxamine 5'-phosphate oxidase family protein, partial [Allocoleopsis sp.]
VYDSSTPAGSRKGLYFTGTATEETEPERISRAFKLLIVRANLNLERSALDYLYSSPRRIYRFQADETWVSGDRVPAGNNQLVDTKILIQLSSLINFFDT